MHHELSPVVIAHLHFSEKIGQSLQPIPVQPFDGNIFPEEAPSKNRTKPSPPYNGAIRETRASGVDLLMAVEITGGERGALCRIQD